jgi:hypothetical protein
MSVLELLLAELDEGFEKKAWHGPNLKGAIRGLTAAQAVWRPAPGRHNIQELVMHAAYWKYVVRCKLTGAKRGSFVEPGSNFFPRNTPDEAGWKRDVATLVVLHKELRKVVASLSAAELRDPRALKMVRGVSDHDIYHAGQIQSLKRLAES